MRLEDVLALWPIGNLVGAALLRIIEHAVLDDMKSGSGPVPLTGKLLLELLSAASQVLIVAAGVGFALLFGRRLAL